MKWLSIYPVVSCPKMAEYLKWILLANSRGTRCTYGTTVGRETATLRDAAKDFILCSVLTESPSTNSRAKHDGLSTVMVLASPD